jgi:hypothetical protein
MSVWLTIALTLTADPAAAPATAQAVVPAVAESSSALRRTGAFLYVETANFRIWCAGTENQTVQLARACEELRTELQQSWLGGEKAARWVPTCDIVVHPTVAEYSRHLGPGSEQSSGCSSIRLDSGRVVERRIDLRADSPAWLTEALPHELTHVVIADRFSRKQIARWADEGMSILAESLTKQETRSREFHASLSRGAIFRVADLLDLQGYPPAHLRGAFYGQSASLVQFLVEQGTPEQFVDFVESGMTGGYDTAARKVYKLQGLEHLEQLWREHVAMNAGVRLASRPSEISEKVTLIIAPAIPR